MCVRENMTVHTDLEYLHSRQLSSSIQNYSHTIVFCLPPAPAHSFDSILAFLYDDTRYIRVYVTYSISCLATCI